MADLSDRIDSVAAGPAGASNDAGSVTQISLESLIAADKYRLGKDALDGSNANGGQKSGWACTRPARIIYPGSQ